MSRSRNMERKFGFDKLTIRELRREKNKIRKYVLEGRSQKWIEYKVEKMQKDGKISSNESEILNNCMCYEFQNGGLK